MNYQLAITLLTSFLASSTASSLRGGSSFSDHRRLSSTVDGECTLANFAAAVGSKSSLAALLGVQNDDTSIQTVLDIKCAEALLPKMDLSDTIGRGPQFLKNFLDGGTTWNDNYETDDGSYTLSVDAAVIKTVYTDSARSVIFSSPDGGTGATYPRYFSNFFQGEKECPLGVIECCYTGARGDTPLEDNAEMCALDMTGAAESNHIKSQSYTFYDTQDSDDTYCSGFAYEKDSFGDAVKYNTLFHMAMKTNLLDKGFVKNIPGAPLCGCVEQMPIVDNAACVEAKEGYKIDSDGNVTPHITWEDCAAGTTTTDLYSYYEGLSGRNDIEKNLVKSKIVGKGQCAAAALSFMNDKMLVPIEE